MTLAELRMFARKRLDDDVTPYKWLDSFLTEAFNRADREASERALLIPVADTSITTVNGTATYTLPSSTILVDRIAINNLPLIKTTRRELDLYMPHWVATTGGSWEVATGTPTHYVQDEYTITLVPTPTASLNLKMRVFRRPTTPMSADADTPEIPPEWHEGLIEFVLGECYNCRDEDLFNPNLAAAHYRRFDEIYGVKANAAFLTDVRAGRRRNTELYENVPKAPGIPTTPGAA